MHAIQRLRQKDPELRAALARRGQAIDWAWFDEQEASRRVPSQRAVEEARAQRNRLAEEAGAARRSGDTAAFAALQETARTLGQRLPDLEQAAQAAAAEQQAWVQRLPNAPHASVPEGHDETANRVVRTVGTPPTPAGAVHTDIAAAFGGIDPAAGAHLAGSRFSVLQGPVARLHRALAQMMLDLHAEAGYREVYVPLLVNEAAALGTGQLPKFADDLFRTTDGMYLIPTAEVPLTNLVANRTLDAADLPLAYCAHTPCFRREAGAAGRDVHGLIRQHQFDKVELVRIEHPLASEEALETLVAQAEKTLAALETPYRVVELCTGDLGFSANRTYDLEVWLPGQTAYREISSCSNTGDFQARRMNARVRLGRETVFAHTLNGSGLAVGRSLVAVLENHIQPDGRLRLPERLRPYFAHRTHLDPETASARAAPRARV